MNIKFLTLMLSIGFLSTQIQGVKEQATQPSVNKMAIQFLLNEVKKQKVKKHPVKQPTFQVPVRQNTAPQTMLTPISNVSAEPLFELLPWLKYTRGHSTTPTRKPIVTQPSVKLTIQSTKK